MIFKLSPSDFAYLYDECKKCYYLKVRRNIPRPFTPFPGVFSALNTKIQGNLIGKNLKSLSKDLPDCVVETQEGFVESTTIPDTSCYIKGKYDLLCKNPDDTYTIVDLKISQPNEEKIDKYKTQLYSYKFSLENPVRDKPIKITKMGLLVLYPKSADFENNSIKVDFPPIWMDIPEDERLFFDFIKEVDSLLKGPMPDSNPKCGFCEYINTRKVA